MKKYSITALSLVLTAALFTGCGCRNNNAEPTTTMPTVTSGTRETTTATTEAATQPTTQPPEKDTTPTGTIDHGNGPLETNATAGADGDTGDARSRTGNGSMGSGGMGGSGSGSNGAGTGGIGSSGGTGAGGSMSRRGRSMPVT